MVPTWADGGYVMQVDILIVVQIISPVMLFFIGWLIRLVRAEMRQQREDFKEFRTELRECVRERECAAHRAQIQRQIEMISE